MALIGCKKASLDDWYATQADQFQEMTDAVNSQNLGYTLDIVTADSDALVFQYTLSKAYDMSDDADADALTQLYDAIFDSYASTFSSLRAQIADETGINGIAIRLTALNPDGTVLYSRDFTE
nr:DUF4854 domain-containing protein [uncultured Roseburia sp.]